MQFRTTGLLLLGAMALPASGTAQTTPAPPAITRTVVAATKLPTVTDVPLHFKAVSITLQPKEKSGISAADGILYQMSGSTEVVLDGEAKMLNAGEALFIAGGKTVALTASSGGPSTFLHFFLAPVVNLGQPAETAPAVVRELYRTANPIPDLKPGGYDLNLTRVTFPAQMPSNPPHHRSGAALYYIISGTGVNTVDGKTEARGSGSLIYETVRSCAPMGKSRKRAVDILGVQHQSGRCGSRASGRTSRKTIANGGRPTASRGRSIPQFPKALGLIQDVGELAEKEGYHPDINFGRVMRLSRRTQQDQRTA
jgi:quercetin dioxygenase-like cupin family protein